jgi:cell division protein FtsB
MSSKRQQTMAKLTRERTVKERRARKLEKKEAAAAERRASREAANGTPPTSGES